MTFQEAINWEWVHSAHTAEDGKLSTTKDSNYIERIIEHARAERGGGGKGFTGVITLRGACRVINANLY